MSESNRNVRFAFPVADFKEADIEGNSTARVNRPAQLRSKRRGQAVAIETTTPSRNCDPDAQHVQPAEQQLALVVTWVMEQVGPKMTVGLQAWAIRRVVLVCKVASVSLRQCTKAAPEYVQSILLLLDRCIYDHRCRFARYHKKGLIRPKECVNTVNFLLQFRRSDWLETLFKLSYPERVCEPYEPEHSPMAWYGAIRDGSLRMVNAAKVRQLADEWRALGHAVGSYAQTHPKNLTDLMLGGWGTSRPFLLGGCRTASEPRIKAARPTTQKRLSRSASWPDRNPCCLT